MHARAKTRLRRAILVAVAAVVVMAPGAATRARPALDPIVRAAPAAPAAGVVRAAAPAVLAAAAPIDLCATTGTISLPGGASAPIWGFARKPATATSCDGVPAQLPGPVLEVAAGDTVTLNITNVIAGHTISMEAPGVAFDPGPTDAAPGDTVSLTFTAGAPGTSVYSSRGDGGRQQAMGLYGALVVCSAVPCPTSGTHLGNAYDRTAVLVLSELDPALNADPSGPMPSWAPTYWLINGKAAPATDAIAAAGGDRVLVRYVNAGPETVTMTMLGLRAKLLARDAYPLDNPIDVVAETVPAGSTADMVAAVPAGAAAGTGFPLYNRQLHLTNGPFTNPQHAPAGGGGMMTFIRVPGP